MVPKVISLKSLSLGQNQNVNRIALTPKVLEDTVCFASSSFWQMLAFLDLWLHHFNLCLHVYITSFACVKSPIGHFWTHLLAFREQTSNPRSFCHLKIFNLISYVMSAMLGNTFQRLDTKNFFRRPFLSLLQHLTICTYLAKSIPQYSHVEMWFIL